jgi:SagB-type dehydrogenase family enzyme
MLAKARLFRRSRSLLFYFRDGVLHCQNFLSRIEITADPALVSMLALLDRWRTLRQLQQSLPEYTPRSISSTISELEKNTIVVRRSSEQDRREEALTAWHPWSIEAAAFHFGTKGVHTVKLDYEEEEFSGELLKQGPAPPAIKRYPKSPVIDLAPAQWSGEFPSTLLRRRTHRTFGSDAITLHQLGTLCALTWSFTGSIEWPGLGPLPVKTSPSGGARHSIEVYVCALRVQGMSPGLYHYRPDNYKLEKLPKRMSPDLATRFCGHQEWVGGAAAVFLMTSVFARVMWRYQSSRAYRVVLLEAGHFCQTFCLAATWLGLAPFCTAALDDELIESTLDIDGAAESVLYAAGVGTQRTEREK